MYESTHYYNVGTNDENLFKLQEANLILPLSEDNGNEIIPTIEGARYCLDLEQNIDKNNNTIHKFKTYTETFDKIIGISIDNERGTALVRYITKITLTPVGEALLLTPQSRTLEVELQKFENGWKIKDIDKN